MKILILLGENDKYLGYKKFENDEELDKFIDKLESLIIANIEGKLSLKQRLKLIDNYFPFAGKVQDFNWIDLDE